MSYMFNKYNFSQMPHKREIPAEKHVVKVHKHEVSKEEGKQVLEGYGFHDCPKFGKHKDKSFYDIANIGDYGYLKWLDRGLFNDGFSLKENCKVHIKKALEKEPYPEATWERKADDDFIWYEFKKPDGEITRSNLVPCKRCQQCGVVKVCHSYINDSPFCMVCQKRG